MHTNLVSVEGANQHSNDDCIGIKNKEERDENPRDVVYSYSYGENERQRVPQDFSIYIQIVLPVRRLPHLSRVAPRYIISVQATI